MAEADIRTLAPVPWATRPTGQVIISLREVDGSPSGLDVRGIVQRLINRFGELGLTPVVASEMEFFLLRDEKDTLGRPMHTQTDRVGGALQTGQTYCIDTMGDMSEL